MITITNNKQEHRIVIKSLFLSRLFKDINNNVKLFLSLLPQKNFSMLVHNEIYIILNIQLSYNH